MVMDDNMWMNVGRSQFHLPTGKPQVLRGKTGIVIEGREALLKRLATVKPKLADTKFDFSEHNDYVQATCPWGNTIRLHEPDAARFGRITLGIPYVEFDVPVGTAKGIAKFYQQMIDVPAEVVNGDGTTAKVTVGRTSICCSARPTSRSRNTTSTTCRSTWSNFSGPHKRLGERGLVNREDNQYQYRFRDITDLDTGKHLFTIEHEVRSLTHPMCLRPLVNRNPAQTARNYANGYDQSVVGDGAAALRRSARARQRMAQMQRAAAAKTNWREASLRAAVTWISIIFAGDCSRASMQARARAGARHHPGVPTLLNSSTVANVLQPDHRLHAASTCRCRACLR